MRTPLLFVICSFWTAALAASSSPYTTPGATQPVTAIDAIVFERLGQLGIEPAALCSDAVFIRRAFLDVTATLPTADEVTAFLSSTDPTKRATLIDDLLARPTYADAWAMKWSDLLRVKAEFPVNLWPNAAQAYHRWLRTALADNMPYDQFARALLTGNGSNFRVAPVNFYRAVQSREPAALAHAVALAFMGARDEHWSPATREGMAAFFARVGYKTTAEWKEEIVFFNPTSPVPPRFVFPDGTVATIAPDADPRTAFADWLTAPDNPWFARAIANRVWSWLHGRGLVHETDDLRDDNPPVHPGVLDLLAREFVTERFDVKHLFRLILNSQTYQLSCVPRSSDPAAETHFAFHAPRRLDAEVLIDALNQITGTTEDYSSAIPEPFTYFPTDRRSVALPDGSISSAFLEMFGRPSRDTGLESERSNTLTATQRLHLLNSSHIRRKIEQGPALQALLRTQGQPRQTISRLYLTILSRPPTDDELRAIERHTRTSGIRGRDAVLDVVWALINSTEFLHQH